MVHRKVVALHLEGCSNSEIDSILKRCQGYASNVLRQPKIRAILSRAYEDHDMRLKALVPKALDTLNRNMDCGDPAVEVRASTEVLKANGKYDRANDSQATAEDVVELLWQRAEEDGSVTTQRVTRRRILSSRTPDEAVPTP